MFDLSALPSTDYRFKDMAGDVWQHRERNFDWDNDWVFTDTRLNLLHCPDETFLTSLCEMIHPVVRKDRDEATKLQVLFSRHVAADGFEIASATFISDRPIFAGRRHQVRAHEQGTKAAKAVADELSSDYLTRQITRMETAVEEDPELAIGTTKEFVESICKHILKDQGVELSGKEDIPQLMKLTREKLNLTSADSDMPEIRDTLRKTLNALATLTQGIAELRGRMGSGHGKDPSVSKPPSEVARLAVSSATALGVFLFDVHQKQKSSK